MDDEMGNRVREEHKTSMHALTSSSFISFNSSLMTTVISLTDVIKLFLAESIKWKWLNKRLIGELLVGATNKFNFYEDDQSHFYSTKCFIVMTT